MIFKDRTDSGEKLANVLQAYQNQEDVLVLALPRGGIPVAYVVAKTLKAPLNIWFAKKITPPDMKEFAVGAVAEQNGEYLVKRHIKNFNLTHDYVYDEMQKKRSVIAAKANRYRADADLPIPEIKAKTVIVVDDGMATGATVFATIDALKNLDAKNIVVALPVAPTESLAELEREDVEIFCLHTPDDFQAVGQFYENFEPVEDEEAIAFLRRFSED